MTRQDVYYVTYKMHDIDSVYEAFVYETPLGTLIEDDFSSLFETRYKSAHDFEADIKSLINDTNILIYEDIEMIHLGEL